MLLTIVYRLTCRVPGMAVLVFRGGRWRWGKADGVGSFRTPARVRASGTSVASRWMQDRVEGGGEVRSAVADHELDPMGLFTEVHEEVAGRLGGPLPGEIRRDAEDADAPGRVFYHGQDVSLGAVEPAGREEVARQDRVGRGAQEL